MPKSLASMRMELTSDFCEKHQRQYMLFNGKSVCPTCQCETFTAETVAVVQDEIFDSLRNKNYNMLYKQSILQDKTLIHAGFKSYTINVTEGTEEARNKEMAFKVFKKYLNGEVFNTWFTGDTGVGKSHLAMSILRSINEMQEFDGSCVFVDIDEVLRRIKDRFDTNEGPYTERYVIDLMVDADFLVIDDLGAETGNIGTDKKATDFVSRIIRAVLNGRQEKPTIFTTNLTRESLQQIYDKKLVSRAMKNTALIHFTNSKDKRVSQIELI
ncbi:ATP-binding protein [Lysinibacillus fusiformis]|uniref:ATP-binding protein n=1 Tax=Lysinibacillus fusiformis TaxID=28031 RepID=UPI003D021A20